MFTLLFTILFTITQSSRLLLQANQAANTQSPNANGIGNGVFIPTGPAHAAQGPEMLCELPNTDSKGCAGRITNLNNPPLDFSLACKVQGACAMSTFNFAFSNNVERIAEVNMAAPWAGYGAKIVIDSCGNAVGQYIDVLECSEMGACQDMEIKLLCGAAINDIKCADMSYCQGCTIKECYENAGIMVCTPKPCWGY